MSKLMVILCTIILLSSSLLLAQENILTKEDSNSNSLIYYDSNGLIIGIEDEVQMISRYPTKEELIQNKYILQCS